MTGLRDPEVYIPKFLKIRTKEGKIAALRPKPAQQMLLDLVKREREAGRPPRILISGGIRGPGGGGTGGPCRGGRKRAGGRRSRPRRRRKRPGGRRPWR